MRKIDIKTTIFEYESLEEFSDEFQVLINEAKNIVKNAYAPYSKFNVGAAVLLDNGKIITGTNQENAAYPSGLCAERVAMFYANSQYPNVPVKALAVCVFTNDHYSESPIPPCGACRQVILETEMRFEKPIQIILAGNKKYTLIEDAKSLLPLHFDDDFFERE
jgi:cytidine deaminase